MNILHNKYIIYCILYASIYQSVSNGLLCSVDKAGKSISTNNIFAISSLQEALSQDVTCMAQQFL